MYRTAVLPSYCFCGAPVAVLLDPARLVRKLARGSTTPRCRAARCRSSRARSRPAGSPSWPPAGRRCPSPVVCRHAAFVDVAQRQEHQRDHQHHPQRREEPGPADQRVPADRAADHLRQRAAPITSVRLGISRSSALRRSSASGCGDTVERSDSPVAPSSISLSPPSVTGAVEVVADLDPARRAEPVPLVRRARSDRARAHPAGRPVPSSADRTES